MKAGKLRYYIYVSEPKVDMLYAQIPKSTRSSLEAELKINLHLVDVSFKEKQFDDTLYSKLGVVEEYLNKQEEVGSIASPKDFFKGSAHLQWARISDRVVFFGGMINNTAVGLGGSLQYVLGNSPKDIEQGGISHTPGLVSFLYKELQLRVLEPLQTNLTDEAQEERAVSATDWWAKELSKSAIQKFDFLAKKLVCTKYYKNDVLLGTPVYVALAR